MTVSIRASLLLSALAMAALTAGFAAPTETPEQAIASANPPSEAPDLTEPAHDDDTCIAGIQPSLIGVKATAAADSETCQPLQVVATTSSLRTELPARCAP